MDGREINKKSGIPAKLIPQNIRKDMTNLSSNIENNNDRHPILWLNPTRVMFNFGYDAVAVLAGFQEKVLLDERALEELNKVLTKKSSFNDYLNFLVSIPSEKPYFGLLSSSLIRTYKLDEEGFVFSPWLTLEFVIKKFKLFPAGVAACLRYSEEVLQLSLFVFDNQNISKTFRYFLGICNKRVTEQKWMFSGENEHLKKMIYYFYEEARSDILNYEDLQGV